MSFKKTSDGKIFFKSANTNLAHEDIGSAEGPGNSRYLGAETQLQILALLRSLNDKLKTTQGQQARFEGQLETFRTLMESLDQRTLAGEKNIAVLKRLAGEGADREQDIEDLLRETREELKKTRQIFMKPATKRDLPDSAYRDALGGLARAQALLTPDAKINTEALSSPQNNRTGFSAFYAIALSLFLVSGAVFLWGLRGFDMQAQNNAASRPSITNEPSDNALQLDLNSDEQLLKLMQDDPDALASRLNKLEPSSINLDPGIAAADLHGLLEPDAGLPSSFRDLEEKAFNGSTESQHNLAALYTAQGGPVKQNYERAAFWFRQAAEKGMANAQYNLGVMYHQGLGVEKDIGQAVRWYKAAAAQAHPEAQYNLGIAYVEGVGVPYDPALAVENFESAAGKGVVEASYNLGLIYENALLGRPDASQALSWYKKAADQGSPEAKQALQQLARTLDIKMEDIDRIIQESGKS